MKGIRVQHRKLGEFMKEARTKAVLSLNDAAIVIGLSSANHLWKCENSKVTFPPERLRRACEVYGVKLGKAVELLVQDTGDSIREFFKRAA